MNFAFVVEHSAHERVQLFEQIFKPSIKRLKKKKKHSLAKSN